MKTTMDIALKGHAFRLRGIQGLCECFTSAAQLLSESDADITVVEVDTDELKAANNMLKNAKTFLPSRFHEGENFSLSESTTIADAAIMLLSVGLKLSLWYKAEHEELQKSMEFFGNRPVSH